jgi:hypothetical protein
VLELLIGHPDRIRTSLGVDKAMFTHLVSALRLIGLSDSRYVTLEEQVAIFLYGVVTGLPIRHIAERFQRSNDTVSKYVCYFVLHWTDLKISSDTSS